MDSIKATWTNGSILPLQPVTWPEGTELMVEPTPLASRPMGLEETQWQSDPAAVAAWEAWVKTLEPRILSDQEQAQLAAYGENHRRFNLDAVRRQMGAGENE